MYVALIFDILYYKSILSLFGWHVLTLEHFKIFSNIFEISFNAENARFLQFEGKKSWMEQPEKMGTILKCLHIVKPRVQRTVAIGHQYTRRNNNAKCAVPSIDLARLQRPFPVAAAEQSGLAHGSPGPMDQSMG